MKKIPFFALCFLIFHNASAQSWRTVQQALPVLEEQTFYLNSQTRIGGKPRNAIKIVLPENAVQWSYAFTTSKREGGGDNLKLLKQVTDFIGKGLLSSNIVGLTTNLAYQVVKPSGAGVVDVYVTNEKGQEQFFATSWNVYSYAKPEVVLDGSRENIKDGTIVINDLSRRTVYLCFNNPSATEGVYVTVEAIAIVTAEQYVDEWTPESKDRFHNACAEALRYQPQVAKDVCDCQKNKITTRYQPSAYEAMGEQEKATLLDNFLEECFLLTGHSTLSPKNRAKALMEEIRGLELVNDHLALTRRYQELLQTGKTDADVYYGLSRHLLCMRDLDNAKAYITQGLGKHPKEVGLWLNLAHHYLFVGNYNEAESIYLRYRGERIAKKLRWEDAVQADFERFRQLGIAPNESTRIQEALQSSSKR